MSNYDFSHEYGTNSSLYDQLASSSERLFILSGFQSYNISAHDRLLDALLGYNGRNSK